MTVGAASGGSGTRGRVVMLVDNPVRGDSRVQKEARSAADAGWEVILLGLAKPNQCAEEWTIGRARVRLLKMSGTLGRRRHGFRRAWIRWPLAYPPNGVAQHRAQTVKAWKADLAVRFALLTLEERSSGPSRRLRLRRRWLAAQLFCARAYGRWVWARTKMLNRARYGRKFRNPWDRAYTWFWKTVLGDRCWRKLEPGLWDYELAFGPVIDELAPDIIHANDFRMLGVGARAAIRARAAGRMVKLVWDAHEFLPGIAPWHDHARWLPGNLAHEREYAKYADAVITVSPRLAELLQETHKLPERPAVVLNAPALDHAESGEDGPAPSLREHCGLGPDVPLLVYSGSTSKYRGLDLMVDALPRLPEAHVAFVINAPESDYMRSVLKRAEKLGVRDRVHVLPFVPYWQLISYLSSADVGVIPLRDYPNYTIALVTKFFEYSHARLPVVVSELKTMADTVRSTGQGEVFRVDDVDDYVRAVSAILADPKRYRAAYDTPGLLDGWTWEAQARVLDEVYTRLMSDGRASSVVPAAEVSA